MTIDQWYAQKKGTSILVPGGGKGNNGQCIQAVDDFRHEVQGLPYVYTPNAKDWWENFEGLGLSKDYVKVTSGNLQPGDIIIWGPLSATDPQGHGDVVSRGGSFSDFWAYDSNWGRVYDPKTGYPILHEVHHNDTFNSKILGALRLKGKGTTSMPYTPEDYKLGAQAAGFQLGKDTNYDPNISNDAFVQMLFKYAPRITKDMEHALADKLTGIKGVIGSHYNSQFEGQLVATHYPKMVDFWANQPKASDQAATVLKPGNYKVQ